MEKKSAAKLPYDERDDARPFFQRQAREVGIYLTVYDAKASGNENIGLQHFFLMKTTEQMYEQCSKMDLVNVRAGFEQRRILKDVYIERFEPGIVLAVGFDKQEDLDALWDLHRKSKLNQLLQETLVTPGVLKAISAESVTLETKLWEDEYEHCKKEVATGVNSVQPIKERDGDMKMVKRLKTYQKTLGAEVSSMRDLENEMESSRADFISSVYSILPENTKTIATVSELEKITGSAKATKLFNKKSIDVYMGIIKKWRAYFKTFDIEIITPLMQIHRSCETQKQRDFKSKLIHSIREMQTLLQPETSQLKTSYPELAKKILRRDARLFLGLLSLVPIGVEKVSDIDLALDDYMRDFKL